MYKTYIKLYVSLNPLKLSHLRNPGIQGYGAAPEICNLRAIDLGYGVCRITSANHAAPEIEAFLKKRFGFEKEGYYLATMMAIGVPNEGNKSPRKKSFEEIYTLSPHPPPEKRLEQL